MSSLSAYEQARAARIARNNSTLAALGLAENAGWLAPQPGRAAKGGGKRAAEGAARSLPGKRQRVERSAGSAEGIRRSPRDPAARGTETRVRSSVRPAAEPWEQSVFKAREACLPAPVPRHETRARATATREKAFSQFVRCVTDLATAQECERGLASSPSLEWDTRRMHQHLTRSPSGRTVATTSDVANVARSPTRCP